MSMFPTNLMTLARRLLSSRSRRKVSLLTRHAHLGLRLCRRMTPPRLHRLMYSLEQLAVEHFNAHRLYPPPMHAFLALPIPERLVLLAIYDKGARLARWGERPRAWIRPAPDFPARPARRAPDRRPPRVEVAREPPDARVEHQPAVRRHPPQRRAVRLLKVGDVLDPKVPLSPSVRLRPSQLFNHRLFAVGTRRTGSNAAPAEAHRRERSGFAPVAARTGRSSIGSVNAHRILKSLTTPGRGTDEGSSECFEGSVRQPRCRVDCVGRDGPGRCTTTTALDR